MMLDLLEAEARDVPLTEGAVLLGAFARSVEESLVGALQSIVSLAPFRRMVTPGGRRMSVAMTNCGRVGWVSDRAGYRYDERDPESGRPWAEMPRPFRDLAMQAAKKAGFPGFAPDACLINRYEPGARLSLHQDRDEKDLEAPIVSVSLGLPAVFLFGGMHRSDPPRCVSLAHGDVVVWGGPSRLRYHGVLPLKDGVHPLLDALVGASLVANCSCTDVNSEELRFEQGRGFSVTQGVNGGDGRGWASSRSRGRMYRCGRSDRRRCGRRGVSCESERRKHFTVPRARRTDPSRRSRKFWKPPVHVRAY